MSVRAAKKGVTDLPEVGPSLFVLSPFGELATHVEGVDEGVEIGAVIGDGRQVDALALGDSLQDTLPDGEWFVAVDSLHVIPKPLRGQRRLRGGFGPGRTP